MRMYKYKVGDKVFVNKDLIKNKLYYMVDPRSGLKLESDLATDDMIRLCGRIVTISNITSYGKYYIEEMGYNWTDEMFSGKACSFCCEGLI